MRHLAISGELRPPEYSRSSRQVTLRCYAWIFAKSQLRQLVDGQLLRRVPHLPEPALRKPATRYPGRSTYACRIRIELGGQPAIVGDFPERREGMHRRIYARIRKKPNGERDCCG